MALKAAAPNRALQTTMPGGLGEATGAAGSPSDHSHAIKRTLVDGTAAATDVVIAGMAVGDQLLWVTAFTTKAAIATQADRTAEYAIQAGGLDKAAGTDETNNQLEVVWIDRT